MVALPISNAMDPNFRWDKRVKELHSHLFRLPSKRWGLWRGFRSLWPWTLTFVRDTEDLPDVSSTYNVASAPIDPNLYCDGRL